MSPTGRERVFGSLPLARPISLANGAFGSLPRIDCGMLSVPDMN